MAKEFQCAGETLNNLANLLPYFYSSVVRVLVCQPSGPYLISGVSNFESAISRTPHWLLPTFTICVLWTIALLQNFALWQYLCFGDICALAHSSFSRFVFWQYFLWQYWYFGNICVLQKNVLVIFAFW